MIIQCEQCQAKFRLDDSKVPPQGRKVRCSKCQSVFFIRRPEAAPPPPPPPAPEPEPEAGFDAGTGRADQAPPDRAQFSDEAFEPTVRIDLAAHHEELAYEEEREAAVPIPRKRRSAARPLLAVVGLLLVLAVAGFVLGQLGVLQLPFLSPTPPESPIANLIIDQNQLKGEWEKNAQVSRIFVINGVVHNQSKKPRAFIKVRGLLLDKSNKQLKQMVAFCGNAIPAQDLRTKATAEMQNSMRNRDGLNGANKLIAPGASIPFTVIFFDVPDGVESFGAEVVEAQIPGAQ